MAGCLSLAGDRGTGRAALPGSRSRSPMGSDFASASPEAPTSREQKAHRHRPGRDQLHHPASRVPGAKYTREWLFSKLIGVTHDVHEPWTAIQVSNRDKTSGIVYSGLAPEAVRLRLAVAIAIFNGESQEVAKELRDELSSLPGGPSAGLSPAPGHPRLMTSQPRRTLTLARRPLPHHPRRCH